MLVKLELLILVSICFIRFPNDRKSVRYLILFIIPDIYGNYQIRNFDDYGELTEAPRYIVQLSQNSSYQTELVSNFQNTISSKN